MIVTGGNDFLFYFFPFSVLFPIKFYTPLNNKDHMSSYLWFYHFFISHYLQTTWDEVQFQLPPGCHGHLGHRCCCHQHLGLLPCQAVHQHPNHLHVHLPLCLVSSQEHYHDLDHLLNYGALHWKIPSCMQTPLVPDIRLVVYTLIQTF